MLLPIIFTMILGTIDAGRMVMSQTMLAYAVTVGARAGTGNKNSQADVQTAVIAAAPMLTLTSSDVQTSNITTTTAGGVTSSTTAGWSARTRGDTVTVTATYNFAPINPLLTKIGSKQFSQTSTLTIP